MLEQCRRGLGAAPEGEVRHPPAACHSFHRPHKERGCNRLPLRSRGAAVGETEKGRMGDAGMHLCVALAIESPIITRVGVLRRAGEYREGT